MAQRPGIMSQQNFEDSKQLTSMGGSGFLRWLFHPDKRQLLLPASGLWILALDWLLFSSNVMSAGVATPIVVVVGFLLGSAGTFLLQRRFAGDVLWKSLVKALPAGLAVGLPWPLAGTILGGWILVASGLETLWKRFF